MFSPAVLNSAPLQGKSQIQPRAETRFSRAICTFRSRSHQKRITVVSLRFDITRRSPRFSLRGLSDTKFNLSKRRLLCLTHIVRSHLGINSSHAVRTLLCDAYSGSRTSERVCVEPRSWMYSKARCRHAYSPTLFHQLICIIFLVRIVHD